MTIGKDTLNQSLVEEMSGHVAREFDTRSLRSQCLSPFGTEERSIHLSVNADGISLTDGSFFDGDVLSLASSDTVGPGCDSAERRYHLVNIALLIAGFCFNFTAFLALQSLQSTLNAEGGIGLLGLAMSAAGQMFSGALLSASAINYFGERRLLQFSAFGFANVIAANALRIDAYIVISFAMFGFLAGTFWPS